MTATATNQPTEPVATEETTPMTEPKERASETRAQPKAPKPEATHAATENADALVSRARDTERERVADAWYFPRVVRASEQSSTGCR